MKYIKIQGARTHNLKNIDVQIPRDQFVVITGLSGSGKSSLAFDTIYAEGQRRYVESLSAYARQFLSMTAKPDVDHIEGLSPAISIEQKSTSHNPRSTVATITEIYDYLRLLFARVGEPCCPQHHTSLKAQTVTEMVDHVLALPHNSKLMLLAPVVRNRKGEYQKLLQKFHHEGYLRARINGTVVELDQPPRLDKNSKHHIEIVIDRFRVKPEMAQRLAESFETALHMAEGLAIVAPMPEQNEPEQNEPDLSQSKATTISRGKTQGKATAKQATAEGLQEQLFSARYACPICDYSISELEPRLFSFNSPLGACTVCDGLGNQAVFDPEWIVTRPHLPIAQGAIKSWDPSNPYLYHMLEAIAQHYDFSLHTPFDQLPDRYQNIMLHGSGTEKIRFVYQMEHGRTYEKEVPFEGIIPNLQRRYKETDSEKVREELAKLISDQHCPSCHGDRLNQAARHVFIAYQTKENTKHRCNLPAITAMTTAEALDCFADMQFRGQKAVIAEKVIKEIHARLSFLVNVGLDYLTLNRSAETLSGGEAQRIRLASQIGAGLVGVTYILDEPSIGLHQRDNRRLLNTLHQLRDLGNTVLVVEHDEEAIAEADYVIDIGPGAGVHGGRIVAQGTPEQIKKNAHSLTGAYLSGRRSISIPKHRHQINPDKMLQLKAASGNNLQQVDLTLPLGLFTCITGVSGSGKSTLINQTLYPIAARQLNRASQIKPAPYASVTGIEQLDKVIRIDQSPIGRTPRSNPATYTGVLDLIRDLFAATQEARARGYKPGRFSFNVKGGRCEACQGDGVIKVEMHFLADVYVSCDLCQGKRYNRETLDVLYKGKNIHEILALTIEDALEFFVAIPALKRKLQTLMDVGLAYIRLGQSATTLSGGEAQRIKLAKELSRRGTGNSLYILDEPTTGLHFHDIAHLLTILHRLRDAGNTIVVIEHNLDVIKTADWVIDLGPEGGSKGGQIIACGIPEAIAKVKHSYTGQFLQKILHPA